MSHNFLEFLGAKVCFLGKFLKSKVKTYLKFQEGDRGVDKTIFNIDIPIGLTNLGMLKFTLKSYLNSQLSKKSNLFFHYSDNII